MPVVSSLGCSFSVQSGCSNDKVLKGADSWVVGSEELTSREDQVAKKVIQDDFPLHIVMLSTFVTSIQMLQIYRLFVVLVPSVGCLLPDFL